MEFPVYTWAVPGCALVGLYLVIRRPRHPVGWLLFGASSAVGGGLLIAEAFPDTVDFWQVSIPIGGLLFGLLLLLYPSGHLASRRWLWVAIALGASTGGFLVMWALSFTPPTLLGAGHLGVFVGSILCCLAAPFARYRRAVGVERFQLRWLAFSAAFTLVAAAMAAILDTASETPNPIGTVVAILGILGFAIGIPASIAVAILKYHLYSIDKIASRVVTYALVTGGSMAVFFVGLALVATLVPTRGSLSVAVATLAAFAIFNPLRRRVQAATDRRFNRARYDTRTMTEGLARLLQDNADIAQIIDEWNTVVVRAVQPASLAIWIPNYQGPTRGDSRLAE